MLTGTPIRSDGAQSVWLAYDDAGAIDHPDAGTYTLTYGEAVDLGYCRPVTFHRHEGKFTVDLDHGQTAQVSGHEPAKLPTELQRIPGLQSALDFYRLARTPLYESGQGHTNGRRGTRAPCWNGGARNSQNFGTGCRRPAGLVIAPSIEMAEYMMKLLEQLDGEQPILVHSQMSNPESKIRAFRNTTSAGWCPWRWCRKGVDIRRLRVLVYLPNALTELAFRQAIGRVVRTCGPDDDTRAYVVMPSFETFETYARRVEEEMSPSARAGDGTPKTKRCPCVRRGVPARRRSM